MASERISPTAHYTGYVWARNGLSHPALATREGRLLFASVEPLNVLSRAFRGPDLEGYLLARHRTIDQLLETAIEDGRVGQVLEIAAGLSPRGLRFAERFGDRLTYVEADLPDMAARKREAVARAGSLGEHHRVVEIDALASSGALSVAAIAGGLDPSRGLAVITEGLLNYLEPAHVIALWQRIAAALGGFPDGLYLSDLHLREDNSGPLASVFLNMLSAFVRGRVHLHFADAEEARKALLAAGFGAATLHRPGTGGRSGRLVQVIEARA